MAFVKYAKAQIVTPRLEGNGWSKVRTASMDGTIASAYITEQATDILGKDFKPSNYLLTHATIVCSVDTVEVPGVKTGAVEEYGQNVTRKYKDYRIKESCDKFINNNLDAWSREVLLKSYKTFIGSYNFVEHVQIPELSKGRIIDAVARDIGDSVYIDILVATDRKHKDLVEAIESGKMSSMSMGCSVDFTICTKCGHVAADETEMCQHIKYEKGNTFYDEQGKQHRVAELCGHHEVGNTGGVTFIEASWVGTPAFPGAVMRNIIQNKDLSKAASDKIQSVLARPPKEWVGDMGDISKAANLSSKIAWGEDEEEGAEAPKEAPNPMKDLEDKIVAKILSKAQKRIENDLADKPKNNLNPENSTDGPNDTVIKEATTVDGYLSLLGTVVKTARSEHELIQRVALLNTSVGISIPTTLYRTALKLGSVGQYKSLHGYLSACVSALGRKPNLNEAKTLIRLGKLLSQMGGHNN